MATFYYRHGKVLFGPIKGSELKQFAKEGRVVPEGEVKKGSDGQWCPASKVQGLFEVEDTIEDLPEMPVDFDMDEPESVFEPTEYRKASPASVPRSGERYPVLRFLPNVMWILAILCVGGAAVAIIVAIKNQSHMIALIYVPGFAFAAFMFLMYAEMVCLSIDVEANTRRNVEISAAVLRAIEENSRPRQVADRVSEASRDLW